MKTVDKLSNLTLRDLLQLAKKRGVHGWHDMRKEQLVRALRKSASVKRTVRPAAKPVARKATVAVSRSSVGRSQASSSHRTTNGKPVAKVVARASVARTTAVARPPVSKATPPKIAAAKVVPAKIIPAKPTPPAVVRRIRDEQQRRARAKDLAAFGQRNGGKGFRRDRLVVMVRDPYWMHAYWEVSRLAVERAEAALGQDWHTARPVLRILDVSSQGTTTSAEAIERVIDVHGGSNNWYIETLDPPKSHRIELGYLCSTGRFFMIARSNVVNTPKAGASDEIDHNWTPVAENFDKIYALSGGYSAEGGSVELQELFEERLRRPMGTPMMTRFGGGFEGLLPDGRREFDFTLDAELLVFGKTAPTAHVTLQGEPVVIRPDGSFTVRFSLPNNRQVIPAVASSADGVEQRTIVLAVERNTKVLEPLTRDAGD